MNVVYASDNNFADIMGVSMISLFENNRECDSISVYVLDDGIAGDNREKLLSVGEKYGREIIFIPVSEIKVPASVQSERWSKSAFIRLMMRRLLPDNLDRILYLDCDVLVLDDLRPLYEIDLGSNTAAGARDCVGKEYRRNIGLEPYERYYNSGILLIQTEKWNEDAFMRFFEASPAMSYPDQDIINGVCGRNMAVLSLRYNCYTALFDFSYNELMIYRRPSEYYTENEVREALSSPAIVHFTTSFVSLRPWVEGCGHPYAGEWLRFRAMSPWADIPLRKDNRSALKKLGERLFYALPRRLALRLAGLLHSRIVPFVRRITK